MPTFVKTRFVLNLRNPEKHDKGVNEALEELVSLGAKIEEIRSVGLNPAFGNGGGVAYMILYEAPAPI